MYGEETVNHSVYEFAIGGALNDGKTEQEFFIATVSVNRLDVEQHHSCQRGRKEKSHTSHILISIATKHCFLHHTKAFQVFGLW